MFVIQVKTVLLLMTLLHLQTTGENISSLIPDEEPDKLQDLQSLTQPGLDSNNDVQTEGIFSSMTLAYRTSDSSSQYEKTDREDGQDDKSWENILESTPISDLDLELLSYYFTSADNMTFNDFLVFWETSVCGEDSICTHEKKDSNLTFHLSCGLCFCNGCEHFGDCCLDKTLSDTKPANPRLAYTSCLSGTGDFSGEIPTKYIMINKCPESWNGDVSSRSMCENTPPTVESMLEYPPIYDKDSRMTYANFHCAKCHQDPSEMQPWSYQMICNDEVELSQGTSPNKIIALLYDGHCYLTVVPPEDANIRRCHGEPFKTIIDTCNVPNKTDYLDRDLETACQMYSSVIRLNLSAYRNVFCALCNGKRLEIFEELIHVKYREEKQSSMADIGKSPSLSIIFNLRPKELSPKVSDCPEDSFNHPIKGLCRKLFCSSGRVLVDRRCKDVLQTARGIGYSLSYQIVPNDKTHSLNRHTLGEAYFSFISSIFTKELKSDSLTASICVHSFLPNVFGETQVNYVKVNLNIVIGSDISQELAENTLLEIYQSVWHYNTLKWVSQFMSSSSETSNGTGLCELFFSDDGLSSAQNFLELTPLSRCNQIQLRSSEYTLNITNGNLESYVTDKEYGLGEYIYEDGFVRVCLDLYSTNETELNMQWNTLTTVSMGISIVCLILTLPVCFLSNASHSIPGKVTISLIITLIVAQLLFITSGPASQNIWSCRLIGMAIHYFWLAVFGWKHVAGYHMYVSFVYPFKKRGENCFIAYVAYAHTVPFVIVLCYTISQMVMSDGHIVGYGDPVCFINGVLDIGLAFVFPVAIVVLSNAFFFVRTICVIRKMSEMQRSSNQVTRNQTIIFVKMFLLLGFTWTIGFLANMRSDRVLWDMFDILNGGIGVFIFLGQLWNKNILSHIRRVLCLVDEKGSRLSQESVLSQNSTKTGLN